MFHQIYKGISVNYTLHITHLNARTAVCLYQGECHVPTSNVMGEFYQMDYTKTLTLSMDLDKGTNPGFFFSRSLTLQDFLFIGE